MTRALLTVLAVVAVGCTSSTAPIGDPTLQQIDLPSTVSFSARVAPDSFGTLTGWLDLTNTSAQLVQVVHGACAFAVQLREGSSGEAIWQNVPAGPQVCVLILRQLSIAPGAIVSVAAGALVGAGAVAPPPAGRHSVSVLLNLRGALIRVPAGTVDLP